jgi:hypothetical protein
MTLSEIVMTIIAAIILLLIIAGFLFGIMMMCRDASDLFYEYTKPYQKK